jgi:hypothetical protein
MLSFYLTQALLCWFVVFLAFLIFMGQEIGNNFSYRAGSRKKSSWFKAIFFKEQVYFTLLILLVHNALLFAGF